MKEINPNKVAIYVRWSTEDQKEGTTLETQLEGCKHYILSQGWQINNSLIFIDDGYSGGSLNRPDMIKIRKYVKDNLIDCIVVHKLDRLSRSVIDTVNLILDEWENKTYLKSATQPIDTTDPMGKQFFYLLISFAEWERNVIRERTLSGKINRAKEGRNSGFIYCYGYRKSPTDHMFEIIPEEAEIVKLIYKKYINDNRGTIGIATDLNNTGIKFRHGRVWSASYIAHILKNKTYIGILEFGKLTNNTTKNYKEKGEKRRNRNKEYISVQSPFVQPIIDAETFNLAQEIRESKNVKNSKISGRCLSSPHLLTGILKCRCGYSRFGTLPKKNDKYAYYYCSGVKQKGQGYCNTGVIRQDILDKIIINKIKEKFLNKENFQEIENFIIENYELKIIETKNNIKNVKTNISSLESQLLRIDFDYRNQKIDANTYNRLYNQIDSEKKLANIKLANLNQQYEEEVKNNIGIEKLKKIPNILEKWDSYSLPEQKNILRDLIKKIVVYKEKGKYNNHLEIHINYWWNQEITS